MFVQTETTPNPNSLKFLPGKIVSNGGSFEITKKDDVQNELKKFNVYQWSRRYFFNYRFYFNK